jgi:hypothetical protein
VHLHNVCLSGQGSHGKRGLISSTLSIVITIASSTSFLFECLAATPSLWLTLCRASLCSGCMLTVNLGLGSGSRSTGPANAETGPKGTVESGVRTTTMGRRGGGLGPRNSSAVTVVQLQVKFRHNLSIILCMTRFVCCMRLTALHFRHVQHCSALSFHALGYLINWTRIAPCLSTTCGKPFVQVAISLKTC